MSDYIKTTNFSAKDSLPSGNPSKIVYGAEIDTEFDNIETAIATKYDSSTLPIITIQLSNLTAGTPTFDLRSASASGWGVLRTSAGTYVITHGLGTANYTVNVGYQDTTDGVFVINNTVKSTLAITLRCYKFSGGVFTLNDPNSWISVQFMLI